MGRFFTDKTEQAIDLLWMQPDTDKNPTGQLLLQQAADEGEADAYCFLGRSYLGLDELEENQDKAFSLLEQGARKGSACCLLTMLQFSALAPIAMEIANSAQLQAAASEVQAKAEGGHAFCQVMMGMYYYWGGYLKATGAKEDSDEDKALEDKLKKAEPWFEKALYSGLTSALNNLHDIYEIYEEEDKLDKAIAFAAQQGDRHWRVRYANRLFDNESYPEALDAFTKLAEDGYIRAWYDAGFQYERGIGVPQDGAKALECYEQGARRGNSTCQTRLGKLLLWGTLGAKDEAQAYFWFCEGGKQEDRIAKMWEGHCLFYGLGVKKDLSKATDLLIDALNFNFPGKGQSQTQAETSQFDWNEDMLQLFWDLGEAYENGWGMPQRDSLAGYYFDMVSDGGWPQGVEKMTHYKKGLLGNWKRIK